MLTLQLDLCLNNFTTLAPGPQQNPLLVRYNNVQGSLYFWTGVYLTALLQSHQPGYSGLRSADKQLFHELSTCNNIGAGAFRYVAPASWNAIQLSVKSSPSFSSFRLNLKPRFLSHPPT